MTGKGIRAISKGSRACVGVKYANPSCLYSLLADSAVLQIANYMLLWAHYLDGLSTYS